jgi:hypothetical protein
MLEELLGNTLHKIELAKWLNVLERFENLIIAPIIFETAIKSVELDFGTAYRQSKEALRIPRLTQRLYLSLIETHLKNWIDSGRMAILVHLDDQFQALMRRMLQKDGSLVFSELTRSLTTPLRRVLIDAIRQLACIDSSSLFDRFRLLITSMKKFGVVQKATDQTDSIYLVIFEQNKGRTFLSTFMLLNAFAMKIGFFTAECPDIERKIWLKLESSILNALREDPTFLGGFITLQEQFEEIGKDKLQNLP